MALCLHLGARDTEPLYVVQRQALVGRGRQLPEGHDIQLYWPTISRRHAVLTLQASGWFVVDLGSTNGTRVNDQKVLEDPVPVKDGDILSFGGVLFLVRIEGCP